MKYDIYLPYIDQVTFDIDIKSRECKCIKCHVERNKN